MFSVTQRISQINKTYIKFSLLESQQFDDGAVLGKCWNKSICGLAVDYLSRMLLGQAKGDAFAISMLGAELCDKSRVAKEYLDKINGTDDESIASACNLVRYDSVVRGGDMFNDTFIYRLDDTISQQTMYEPIRVMVKRTVNFFSTYYDYKKELIAMGSTFTGGYTTLVSKGDCDYVVNNGIWDLKCSYKKPTGKDLLQVASYIILGEHSENESLHNKHILGIFNAYLNTAYYVYICDIEDEMQEIAHDVLGLLTFPIKKIAEDGGYITANDWRDVLDEDREFISSLKAQNHILAQEICLFDPDSYEDGIYKVKVLDYWTWYRQYYAPKYRETEYIPSFRGLETVSFIKSGKYKMFMTKSKKGKYSILQGATRRRVQHSEIYFLENLIKMGNSLEKIFGGYWEAMTNISSAINNNFDFKALVKNTNLPREMHFYQKTNQDYFGRIHGCIIDIDYLNHIYIDPFTSEIVFYHAPSMGMMQYYTSIGKMIEENKDLKLLCTYAEKNEITINPSLKLKDISENEHRPIDNMYDISRIMQKIQPLFEAGLICVWFESILGMRNNPDIIEIKTAMIRDFSF